MYLLGEAQLAATDSLAFCVIGFVLFIIVSC